MGVLVRIYYSPSEVNLRNWHMAVECPRCGGTGTHKTNNMSERVCGFCLGARKVAVEKARAERVRISSEAKEKAS